MVIVLHLSYTFNVHYILLKLMSTEHLSHITSCFSQLLTAMSAIYVHMHVLFMSIS